MEIAGKDSIELIPDNKVLHSASAGVKSRFRFNVTDKTKLITISFDYYVD